MTVTGRRNSSFQSSTGSHRVFSGYKEREAELKTSGEGWLIIVTELGSLRCARAAVAEGNSTSCTIMWAAFVTVSRWAIAGGELFGDKKSTPVWGINRVRIKNTRHARTIAHPIQCHLGHYITDVADS
jgi:hypothetical protein